MRAAARAGEKFLDFAGEAARDRHSLKLFVVVNDCRAIEVRVLVELHIRLLNDECRKVDFEIKNHVVHPKWIWVALDVQADGLLVDYYPAQHQTVVSFAEGAHFVAAGVNADVVGVRGKHFEFRHP